MTSSRAAPLSRALRSCRPARRRPSARSPGPKLGRWRALRGSGSPSQELAEALLNGRSRNSGRLRGTQEHSFSASIPCVSGNRPLRMTQALDTRGWPEPTFHCNTESQQQPSARSWQRRPGQLARAHRNRASRFWQQPLHRSRTPLPQKQSPEASEMPGRAVHTSAEDGGSAKTSASCCCACTRTVLCIFFSMLGIVRAAAMLAHRSAERRPAMARAQGSRPNPVYRGGAAAETLARFGLADTCGAGLVRGGLLPDTTRALRRN